MGWFFDKFSSVYVHTKSYTKMYLQSYMIDRIDQIDG